MIEGEVLRGLVPCKAEGEIQKYLFLFAYDRENKQSVLRRAEEQVRIGEVCEIITDLEKNSNT